MRLQRRSRLVAIAGLLALCILFAIAAGCGGSEEGEEEGEEATASATIPAELSATEADAEDLVDVALEADRAAMREKAARLRRDAQAAAEVLAREHVPRGELRPLRARAADADRLAAAGDPVQVALAANAVSALMPTLYARFEPAVPPGVLELDYLDREAQLRSLANETSKVSTAVGVLEETWRDVRPEVVAAGGEQEAERFSEHVAALKRLNASGDAEALRREAVNGLNLVDELEQVF